MKRAILFFLLGFTLLNSACAGGLTQASPNCAEGICVKLQVTEPVRFNELVTVIITVSTEKDMPELGMTLDADSPNIVVEGPQGWETDSRDGVVWKGGAGWSFTAKANKPVRFTRTIRFPPREGFFLLVASASIPTHSHLATDSVHIDITPAGGTVYYSGTPLPITPYVVNTPPPYILNPQGTPLPSPTRIISFPPTPTRRPYP